MEKVNKLAELFLNYFPHHYFLLLLNRKKPEKVNRFDKEILKYFFYADSQVNKKTSIPMN